MWAPSTTNVGIFHHVGRFDLWRGLLRPSMRAGSTMWADSTLCVGGFNLRVGRFDQDTNPNPNPNPNPNSNPNPN